MLNTAVNPYNGVRTNDRTRYEIVALRSGHCSVLIRYTVRQTRRTLIEQFFEALPYLESIGGIGERWAIEKGKPHMLRCGEWTVYYSGRTERDARGHKSELPFVRTFGKAVQS